MNDTARIDHVMSPVPSAPVGASPWMVSANDPFEKVLGTMIDRRVASVLVLDSGGRVVGSFSVIDALHLLRTFVILGSRGPEDDEIGTRPAFTH